MTQIQPLLVSINDAARVLAVSRSTIYRMIGDGVLPTRKVRHRTLIEVERLRDAGLGGR